MGEGIVCVFNILVWQKHINTWKSYWYKIRSIQGKFIKKMKKQKELTLDAAQGAGTMSAPESEISNIATVTIDKLNDKDEVVETEELKL